jgi:hypothetical protein
MDPGGLWVWGWDTTTTSPSPPSSSLSITTIAMSLGEIVVSAVDATTADALTGPPRRLLLCTVPWGLPAFLFTDDFGTRAARAMSRCLTIVARSSCSSGGSLAMCRSIR